ncbi:MAG: hypothetical protein HYZ91_00495, partial [Candidatus Omnitrophica bacterium]|nr:hypothetical protein [Candidatus Omnitrophota bacterium]
VFGSQFASAYQPTNKLHRALATTLAQGLGSGTYEGFVLNDALTDLEKRTDLKQLSPTALAKSLDNQAALRAEWTSFAPALFGMGDYDPANPIHRALLAQLESVIKLPGVRETGTIVELTDELETVTSSQRGVGSTTRALTSSAVSRQAVRKLENTPLVFTTVDELLQSLRNQAALAQAVGEWGAIFGLDGYNPQDIRHRAIVSTLESQLPLGNRQPPPIVLPNATLTGIERRPGERFVFQTVDQLLVSLRNQATLIAQRSRWLPIFGLSDYDPRNPVHRAIVATLESLIKLQGIRERGTILVPNNTLTGVEQRDNQPLDFENVTQLLESLDNQRQLIAHKADWLPIFGLSDYDPRNVVHRAIVGSLESLIKLGPRTTGTIVLPNDPSLNSLELHGVDPKSGRPLVIKFERVGDVLISLPNQQPLIFGNVNELLTSLRNQTRIVRETGDALVVKYGLGTRYDGRKKVHRAVLAMEESVVATSFRAHGTIEFFDETAGKLMREGATLTKGIDDVIRDLRAFQDLVSRADLFRHVALLYGLGAAYQGRDRHARTTIQSIIETIGPGRTFKDVQTFKALLDKAVELLPEIQRKLTAAIGHPLVLGQRHGGFAFQVRGGQLVLAYFDRFDRALPDGLHRVALPKVTVSLVRHDLKPDYRRAELDITDIAHNFDTVHAISVLRGSDERLGEVYRDVYRFYRGLDAPIGKEQNTYDARTGRLEQQRRNGLVTRFRYGEDVKVERNGLHTFWDEFDPRTAGPSYIQIPISGETREEATGRLVSTFQMERAFDLQGHRIGRRVEYYLNGDASRVFKSVEEVLDLRTGSQVSQRLVAGNGTVAEVTYEHDAEQGGDLFLGIASKATTRVNNRLHKVSSLRRDVAGTFQVDLAHQTLEVSTDYYLPNEQTHAFKNVVQLLDLGSGSILRETEVVNDEQVVTTYAYTPEQGGNLFIGLAAEVTTTVDGTLAKTASLRDVDLETHTIGVTTTFHWEGKRQQILKSLEEDFDIVSGAAMTQQLTAGDGTQARVAYTYNESEGGDIFLKIASQAITTDMAGQRLKTSRLERIDARTRTAQLTTTFHWKGRIDQVLKTVEETADLLTGAALTQSVTALDGTVAITQYEHKKQDGGSRFLGLASRAVTRVNGELLKVSVLERGGVDVTRHLISMTTTSYLRDRMFKTVAEQFDVVSGSVRGQRLTAGDGSVAEVRYAYEPEAFTNIFLGVASRTTTLVDHVLWSDSVLDPDRVNLTTRTLVMNAMYYWPANADAPFKHDEQVLNIVSGSIQTQTVTMLDGTIVRTLYDYDRSRGGNRFLNLAAHTETTVNGVLFKTQSQRSVDLEVHTIGVTTTFYWEGRREQILKTIEEEFGIVSGATVAQKLTAGDGTVATVRHEYDRTVGLHQFAGVASMLTTRVDGVITEVASVDRDERGIPQVDPYGGTIHMTVASFLNGDEPFKRTGKVLDFASGAMRTQTLTGRDGSRAPIRYDYANTLTRFLGVADRTTLTAGDQVIRRSERTGIDLSHRTITMATTSLLTGELGPIFTTAQETFDLVSGSVLRQRLTMPADPEEEPAQLLVDYDYSRALHGNIFLTVAARIHRYEYDGAAADERGPLLSVASLETAASGRVRSELLPRAASSDRLYGAVYSIEQVITKVQSQQVRDGLGQLIAEYTGSASSPGGRFVPEAVQIMESRGVLQWLGLTTAGRLYAFDGTRRLSEYQASQALIVTEAMDTNHDGIVDGRDFIEGQLPVQFTNQLTTLKWIQRFDALGRGRAKIDFGEDGAEQIIQIPHYRGLLGLVGLAVKSHTYAYVPGRLLRHYDPAARHSQGGPLITGTLIDQDHHPLTTSDRTTQLGFVRADGSVWWRYEDHVTKVVSQQLISNQGLLVANIRGKVVGGVFHRRLVELSQHEGILKLLGIGVTSDTYVYNPALGLTTELYRGQERPLISGWLVNASGDPARDLSAINRADGSVTYHQRNHVTHLDSEDVWDKWGKVTIHYFISREDGRSVREKALYLAYDGLYAVHRIATMGQVYALDQFGHRRDHKPFKVSWLVGIDPVTGDVTNQLINFTLRETWQEVIRNDGLLVRDRTSYKDATDAINAMGTLLPAAGVSVEELWDMMRTGSFAAARQELTRTYVAAVDTYLSYDDSTWYGQRNLASGGDTFYNDFTTSDGVRHPSYHADHADVVSIDPDSGDLTYQKRSRMTGLVTQMVKNPYGFEVGVITGYRDFARGPDGFVPVHVMRATFRPGSGSVDEIADDSVTYRVDERGRRLFRVSESDKLGVDEGGMIRARERLWTQGPFGEKVQTVQINGYKQRGSRQEIRNEITGEATSVAFDQWGLDRTGETYDLSDHPSLIDPSGVLGTLGADGPLRRESRVLSRGIRLNPYLPDRKEEFWTVKQWAYYDRWGDVLVHSEQWNDRYGKPVLDVLKTSNGKEGRVYYFHRDGAMPWREMVAPSDWKDMHLPTRAPVNVGDRDFLSFYAQYLPKGRDGAEDGVLEVEITPANGKPPIVFDRFHPPYVGTPLYYQEPNRTDPVSLATGVMLSDWLKDETVKLIPVKEIQRQLGTTEIARMRLRYKPHPGRAITGTLKVSDVFRLGAPGSVQPQWQVRHAQDGKTSIMDLYQVRVLSEGLIEVTRKITPQPGEKRKPIQLVRVITVYRPDGRKLQETMVYEYDASGRGDVTKMEERAVRFIYDQAGDYPVVSVDGKTGTYPTIILTKENAREVKIVTKNPKDGILTTQSFDPGDLNTGIPDEIRLGFIRVTGLKDGRSDSGHRIDNVIVNILYRLFFPDREALPPGRPVELSSDEQDLVEQILNDRFRAEDPLQHTRTIERAIHDWLARTSPAEVARLAGATVTDRTPLKQRIAVQNEVQETAQRTVDELRAKGFRSPGTGIYVESPGTSVADPMTNAQIVLLLLATGRPQDRAEAKALMRTLVDWLYFDAAHTTLRNSGQFFEAYDAATGVLVTPFGRDMPRAHLRRNATAVLAMLNYYFATGEEEFLSETLRLAERVMNAFADSDRSGGYVSNRETAWSMPKHQRTAMFADENRLMERMLTFIASINIEHTHLPQDAPPAAPGRPAPALSKEDFTKRLRPAVESARAGLRHFIETYLVDPQRHVVHHAVHKRADGNGVGYIRDTSVSARSSLWFLMNPTWLESMGLDPHQTFIETERRIMKAMSTRVTGTVHGPASASVVGDDAIWMDLLPQVVDVAKRLAAHYLDKAQAEGIAGTAAAAEARRLAEDSKNRAAFYQRQLDTIWLAFRIQQGADLPAGYGVIPLAIMEGQHGKSITKGIRDEFGERTPSRADYQGSTSTAVERAMERLGRIQRGVFDRYPNPERSIAASATPKPSTAQQSLPTPSWSSMSFMMGFAVTVLAFVIAWGRLRGRINGGAYPISRLGAGVTAALSLAATALSILWSLPALLLASLAGYAFAQAWLAAMLNLAMRRARRSTGLNRAGPVATTLFERPPSTDHRPPSLIPTIKYLVARPYTSNEPLEYRTKAEVEAANRHRAPNDQLTLVYDFLPDPLSRSLVEGHEQTHVITRRWMPGAPRWIHEGIAHPMPFIGWLGRWSVRPRSTVHGQSHEPTGASETALAVVTAPSWMVTASAALPFESILHTLAGLSLQQHWWVLVASGVAGLILRATGSTPRFRGLRHLPVNLAFSTLVVGGGYLGLLGTGRLVAWFSSHGYNGVLWTWLTYAAYPLVIWAWNLFMTGVSRAWRWRYTSHLDRILRFADPNRRPLYTTGTVVQGRIRDSLNLVAPDSLALAGLQRFNRNVMGTVRGWRNGGGPATPEAERPNLYFMRGDAETLFHTHLLGIYLLVAEWRRHRLGLSTNMTAFSPHLTAAADHLVNSDDAYLQQMDNFAKAVGRYLAEELTRGHLPSSQRKYFLPGEVDDEVWAQTEAFLKGYRDRLARALVQDLADADAASSVIARNAVLDAGAMSQVVAELGLDTNRYAPPVGVDYGSTADAAGHVRQLLDSSMGRQRLDRVHFFWHKWARQLPLFLLAIVGIMLFNPVNPGWETHPMADFLALVVPSAAPVWPLLTFAALLMVYTVVSEFNRLSRFAPFLPSLGRWETPGSLPLYIGNWVGRGRAIFPLIGIRFLAGLRLSGLSLHGQIIWITLFLVLAAEALSLLLSSRSLLAVLAYFHLRPAGESGRWRLHLGFWAHHAGFLAAIWFLGGHIFEWFTAVQRPVWQQLAGLGVFVLMGLMLMEYGVRQFVKTVFTLPPFASRGPGQRTVWWRAFQVGVAGIAGWKILDMLVPGWWGVLGTLLSSLSAMVGLFVMTPPPEARSLTASAQTISRADPHKTALVFAGGQPFRSTVFQGGTVRDGVWEGHTPETAARQVMDHIRFVMRMDPHGAAPFQSLIAEGEALLGNDPEAWLRDLFEAEDQKHRTLFSTSQLTDTTLLSDPTFDPYRQAQLSQLYFGDALVGGSQVDMDAALQSRIEYAYQLRRLATILNPPGGASSLDTAMNLVEMAEWAAEEGLADRLVFYLVSNEYQSYEFGGAPGSGTPANLLTSPNTPASWDSPLGGADLYHRIDLGLLIEHKAHGAHAYTVYDTTGFGSKAGAMNGIFAVPDELPYVDTMLIMDRNMNALDREDFLADVHRIRANPDLAVMNGFRTTSLITHLGDHSRLIEGGHGTSMSGLQDFIGTGWANFVRVPFWDTLRALSWPGYPTVPLLEDEQVGPWGAGFDGLMRRLFGLIGFNYNAVGISEDHWSVWQQVHTLLALGRRPHPALNKHTGIKIRETFIGTEIQTAPNRWSAGLAKTDQDPMQQLLTQFGPLSYVERETRAGTGDFYTVAPYGVLMLLVFPFSVLWGFSPFVGISLVFFFMGAFFNQILTLPALVLGWRMGGWTGAARWLRMRVRDMLLFAFRLVLEAMAQIQVILDVPLRFWLNRSSFWYRLVRRSDPEFGISGGQASWTARAVRPALFGWQNAFWPLRWNPSWRPADWLALTEMQEPDGSSSWVPKPRANFFQSVGSVVIAGFIMTGLNVWVLWRNLDVLNVLMMLFPLYISVGAMIGPFIMLIKPGRSFLWGFGDALAKFTGYALALATLSSVALLRNWVAGNHVMFWVGLGGVALVLVAGIPLSMWILFGGVPFTNRLRWYRASHLRAAARLCHRPLVVGLVLHRAVDRPGPVPGPLRTSGRVCHEDAIPALQRVRRMGGAGDRGMVWRLGVAAGLRSVGGSRHHPDRSGSPGVRAGDWRCHGLVGRGRLRGICRQPIRLLAAVAAAPPVSHARLLASAQQPRVESGRPFGRAGRHDTVGHLHPQRMVSRRPQVVARG